MSQEFSDLDDLDSGNSTLLTNVRPHIVPIILGLFGALFIGLGIMIIFRDIFGDTSDGIEVLETNTQSEGGQIIVEVSGAVNSPGIYEMETDNRVGDAIEKAGGQTDDADTEWMTKVLNRAAYLTDGQKIFIPTAGQQSVKGSATENEGDQNTSSTPDAYGGGLVNINTATLSELDALWGIGQVTGQKIIEQRPYSSVEELLSRKVLKSNVYETNKNLLTVY